MKKLNTKDIRNILYTYPKIKAEIIAIEFDIQEVNQGFEGINSGGTNDIKPTTPTNQVSSMIESEVIRKDEKIESLNRIKSIKEREVSKIENMLSILDSKEREIVKLKYFEKCTNRTIGYRVNLGEDRVSQKNNLILSCLANFLNNRTNVY